MVAALAPMGEAKIEETWDPVGLAGTGSHDVHFDDVFVPWHRTFPWPAGIPVSAYPAAIFVPGTWFVSICAGATHLGLARRALDEARNELRGKTDRYTQKPLLEHPATQRNLEAAEGLWFACRAGMREALAAMWESALRGEPATADLRINARRRRRHGGAAEARKSCAPPTMLQVRAQCAERECCSASCGRPVASRITYRPTRSLTS